MHPADTARPGAAENHFGDHAVQSTDRFGSPGSHAVQDLDPQATTTFDEDLGAADGYYPVHQ